MIRINNLKFSYHKNRDLFSDLHLELSKGHIYGLLGKNGAGKTTLLKLMTGLCFPIQGEVKVFGTDSFLRTTKMLEKIYFLPEEIYSPSLKISNYLSANSVFYPNFDNKLFYDLLEELEFDQFNDLISKLSLGQKKKVAIAFAIAAKTDILIMDEPTNGLDIPSKSIFRKIIARIATEDRIILISTHQVRDLHSLLDSVIILDGGSIILNETVDGIMKKLKFGIVSPDNVSNEKILYSENNIGGLVAVFENTYNEDTNLDLELLFNATMLNKSLIYNMFNAKNE